MSSRNPFNSGHNLPYALSLLASLLLHSPTVRAQAPSGWIQDHAWLLLGPLGNSNGCGPGNAMLQNWIAPADIAALSPAANEPIDIDFNAAASTGWQGIGDEPVWISLEEQGLSGNDVVDLIGITSTLSVNTGEVIPGLNGMAVLVTYVTYLGTEPILVNLCDASDDSVQIWVNNARVVNVSVCRGTAPSCSETTPVLLVPGKNVIKALVWQGDGGWGLRVRLSFIDGPVITDAEPDFAFGYDPDDVLVLSAATITRTTSQSLPECSDGGDLAVTLTGNGAGGPAFTLTETVRGLLEVRDITGGGVFTPLEPPVKAPVDIFEDARDVGGPCVSGSTTDNGGGSYTVTGAGIDIWTIGDEFQFAYRELTGDFTMTAHVSERLWASGARWGKSGLMARQDLWRYSRYSMIQTHGEDLQDADRFAGRRTHGGEDNFELTPLLAGEHRDWLRLSRVGSTFTGEMSEDGVTWQVIGTQDWGDSAPRTVLVGLAVSAHSDGQGGCVPAAISFDEIEITGGDEAKDPPGPPTSGTITWNLTRAQADLGVGYKLRGSGIARITGHDGEHVTLGAQQVTVQSSAGSAGIFTVAHDIGNPCVPGETLHDSGDGSYTITGSGIDIWQNGDQFQYAYRQFTGDFSMIAHVRDRAWAAGTRWGKVGIMARQDCTSRSRYAMLQTHGEDLQDFDRFAGRPTHGGADNFEQSNLTGSEHRDWLRLDRVGNTFVGFFSEDGVTWQQAAAMNWGAGAPATVLIGLAVNAHSDVQGGCVPATIVFDNVDLSVPSYSLTRAVGTVESCPTADTSERVVIKGQGDPGPNLAIAETVRGDVIVSEISNFGRFTPFPDPSPLVPVGIFEDSRDVGAPCAVGSTFDEGNGTYTVTGGGIDIWQTGDQFQYAYTRVSGDFNMVARVDQKIWAPGTRWGKVGIMARENLTDRSRYAMMQTHGADLQDADRLAGRPTHGGSNNFERTTLGGGEQRDWMRLERIDNDFNSYASFDGSDWQLIGTMRWGPEAPRTVLLGLAVCAHSDGGCNTATITFGDVELSGGEGPHDPLTLPGGTINWAAPRTILSGAGISYKVSGKGLVTLSGTAGNLVVGGPNTTTLADYKETGLGELEAAHDIGAPCIPGVSDFDAGTGEYTITGSGIDIWQGGDQFQFAYKRVAGDFSMVAHVAERTWAPGSRWGKVGIMARQDCTERSRYSMAQTHGEDLQDADRFAARPTHGGADNFEQTTLQAAEHRDWLRLDRIGNLFTAYMSEDGSTWENVGSNDWGVDAPAQVLLGLAVCAHSDGVEGCLEATIVFDSVEISTSTGGGELFHRGDADDNGALQITDAVRVLGFLFLGQPPPTCLDAADADDSGSLQLTDAVRILGFLFLGGPPPEPPGPPSEECGPDPGDTHLGCESYTSC